MIPKGQGAMIKVVSLAIGLTVGLVLIAKVQLERNFNHCVVDVEHTYEISETFQRHGQEMIEYSATAGGIVPALCQYIPEIVVGTRYTYQYTDEKLMLENGQRYEFSHAILADSCLFDIFGTRVLQGEARRILSTKGQCLISRRLNERLGGHVVGKTITFLSAPGRPLTVAGIFENYDENTSFNMLDIVISLPSIGDFTWDGTSNLLGNDRYHSLIRLRDDADMKKVEQGIRQMVKEMMPWSQLKAAGYEDVGYNLYRANESRQNDTSVRTTNLILSVVAFVMLFTAVMNYILVVISSLVGRARLVAVRKVLGAPQREFYLTTLREAVVHLLLALAVMVVLLWAGQDCIRDLMGISVQTLFSRQTYLTLSIVCLLVLVCCGLLPGYIYSRIPLAYAYRLFSESRRVWKLTLLAFQFVLSTMLLCILTTIYRQYDYLLDKDLGYDYEEVAYIEVLQPSDSTFTLAREIEKLSCVTSTSTAYSLPMSRQSGNNVRLPGTTKELFNYACMYFAEASYLKTMGLTLVQGREPTLLNTPGWKAEAIVDERFAQMMKEFEGWDSPVGKAIMTTELGDEPITIVGVVSNYTIGTLLAKDERPSMYLNGNIYANHILIRFNELTPENLLAVQTYCDERYPNADLVVKRYADGLADSYQDTQHTRDLILIGCLASLLITLIGLIGYIRDEVQRRTRELAIRKVMGATVSELQQLFLRNIALIALPSIVVGVVLGWYFSQQLMEQFADRVDLLWWIFALDALVVILIITVVVYLQTYRVALRNPVENIKTE